MARISGYKDLLIWRKAMDLVEKIYRATEKFPKSEQWGLTAQMRHAAISVPSNIAEGYGRQTTGEYRHHLAIARGSLLEIETQVLASQRLRYLDNNETLDLINDIDPLSRMISVIIMKLTKGGMDRE